MINFTRAFGLAWERMMIILFRPFDFGKWCLIGLSAFLAGMLKGGNGVNFRYNQDLNKIWDHSNTTTYQSSAPDWQKIHSDLANFFTSTSMVLVVVIAAAVFLFIIVLAVVLMWLGSRGQFLFLDNISRNRGEIAWPWQRYAREATSLFLFYLLMTLVSLVIFLPILIIALIMAWPFFQQDRWPVGGEFTGFIILGLLYLVLGVALNVVLFLFLDWGVPMMFRNNLRASQAFMTTLRLAARHAGTVFVYLLLRVALAIAGIVVALVACCATCCLAIIPYVGTVILLPWLVYVRCFSLDCLAQLGLEYDVWTVDVAPPASSFPSPRPPLG